MKIINPACTSTRTVREELLDQYLLQLLDKVGWVDQDSLVAQSFDTKDEWRRILEGAIAIRFEAGSTKRTGLASNEFHKFKQLPTEVRLQIWELAFDLDERKTLVHCVDERGGRFISNQPLSVALHTCHEARNLYLSHRTCECATFAFGTYIDFEIDTIYLINYENDAEMFKRFLESPSASQIQNLAMRKSLACDIPMPGHMSDRQFEMLEKLESWTSLAVVFHDRRTREEAWGGVGMRLRHLSAREKRRHAEIAYARFHSKTLNSMMRGVDVDETDYSFVRVVENKLC
ncbi:hypothetical protein VTL71DRAFT_1924 [Oculimacula yallundae]|uniref:2EXR domain-containing protein n=1 Tax=Oculimacula yallundae TaxID=86028 RepID=A0ABR4CC65_9HELO